MPILKRLNTKIQSCAPNPGLSSTTQTTLLQQCSFGFKVICIDEKFSKPTMIYTGSDASQKLIESLMKEQREIEQILETAEPFHMTAEDEEAFRTATRRCLCRKSFTDNETKVKHYQHFHKPNSKDYSNFVGSSSQ